MTTAPTAATRPVHAPRAPRVQRVTYGRLTSSARATIQDYGLSVAAYIRDRCPDGVWTGDRCGCPDGRCRGHHHDSGEECGCVYVVAAELARLWGPPQPPAPRDPSAAPPDPSRPQPTHRPA